jgi:DNA-binding beta-propeller fold protein YncE
MSDLFRHTAGWQRCHRPVIAACIAAAVLLLVPVVAVGQEQEWVRLPARTIQLPAAPGQFLLHDGKLYVSCFHGSSIAVYDPATGKQLRSVDFDVPGEMVVANGKLFVGRIFSEDLVVFDPASMKVVQRIPVGGEASIIASADGKTVYHASNKENCFRIIDAATYKYTTVPYPEGGFGIGTVALSPDGKRLYLGIQRGGKPPTGKSLSSGNTFVAVYDLAARKYAGTVYLADADAAVGGDSSIVNKILPSPDGRRLYVGLFQSPAGIKVVDARKLQYLHPISFEVRPNNSNYRWVNPTDLAFVQKWLVSANRTNGELAVIDPGSSKVLARFRLPDVSRKLEDVPMPTSKAAGAARDLNQLLVQNGKLYIGDAAGTRIIILDQRDFVRALQRVLRTGKQNPVVEVLLQE